MGEVTRIELAGPEQVLFRQIELVRQQIRQAQLRMGKGIVWASPHRLAIILASLVRVPQIEKNTTQIDKRLIGARIGLETLAEVARRFPIMLGLVGNRAQVVPGGGEPGCDLDRPAERRDRSVVVATGDLAAG